MKDKLHNLLIILGSIFLVECIVITGIVLSALWFIENGI